MDIYVILLAIGFLLCFMVLVCYCLCFAKIVLRKFYFWGKYERVPCGSLYKNISIPENILYEGKYFPGGMSNPLVGYTGTIDTPSIFVPTKKGGHYWWQWVKADGYRCDDDKFGAKYILFKMSNELPSHFGLSIADSQIYACIAEYNNHFYIMAPDDERIEKSKVYGVAYGGLSERESQIFYYLMHTDRIKKSEKIDNWDISSSKW